MFGHSFLLCILSLSCVSALAATRYPVITEVHGDVQVAGKDGRSVKAKLKQSLIEKATLKTGVSSWVKVDLDGERSFIVQEKSEVRLPAISWESGQAPVVLLEEGSLRWQQPHKKTAYNVALRSDLFEFIPPAGDYVFVFDPSRAYAEVRVYKGGMEFSALNGESSVWVKTGQQAGFQGLLEEGQIAYDILLKGKKIPRGALTPIKPLSKNELALEEARLKELKEAKARRENAARKAAEQAKREGLICDKPQARLNECAWVCEGNPKSEKKDCLTSQVGVSCVRQRCNANGQWAEQTPLSAEAGRGLCGAQPVVAPCDY